MTDTMLIVDDEPLILEATAEMLEQEGYDVLKASSANQALEIAQGHFRISLLLTDINMPGTSGLALAERLTSQHPEMRLVVMSGRQYLDDGELPDSRTFLPKPFTYRQLLNSIRAQLGKC